jgi:hypothetical protein
MMKKHGVRILTAFLGLAAVGAAAHGQVLDQLTVKIPYEFVVAGKTLPAGTYKVNRVDYRDSRVLALSSFENRVTAFVLANEVAGITGAEKPGVSFEQVGNQHLLSKIETAEHVFTISVSSPAGVELAMKRPAGQSGSGSSGNN